MTFPALIQTFAGAHTVQASNDGTCGIDWVNMLIYIGYGPNIYNAFSQSNIRTGAEIQWTSVTTWNVAVEHIAPVVPPMCVDGDGNIVIYHNSGCIKVSKNDLSVLDTWGGWTFGITPPGLPYSTQAGATFGPIVSVQNSGSNFTVISGPGGGFTLTRQVFVLEDIQFAGQQFVYPDLTCRSTPGLPNTGVVYFMASGNLTGPGATDPLTLYKITCTPNAGWMWSNWPTPNPAITVTTLGTIPASAIDPAWTQITCTALCLDQTDGNIIMMCHSNTTSNDPTVCKIDVSDLSIPWTYQNGTTSPLSATTNLWAFSRIRNQRLCILTKGTSSVVTVDTSDGSASVETADTSHLGTDGSQAFDDTTGILIAKVNWAAGAGGPTGLNGSTAPFLGWAALYVAPAPAPPPGNRRFLADMGPVRKLQLSPTPPGPPTNSVGNIELDIEVAGVGAAGSIGEIDLDIEVAGVGSGGDTSTGTIDLNIAVAGVGSGGASALLTTMTLINTSASFQPINFVTDIFGHPFKKGDIPSGTAPKFELTDGTNIPFSMGKAPVYWSDGSLKWAPFMLLVPRAIAGGGSLIVNIKSGGSTPTPSSRMLSDFASGGTDLNIFVTGLDNLSGNWTFNLNQGIAAAHADDYVYMDGPAGKVWRVRASARQSGADHGQLESYWYIQAPQNELGGLYGLRFLARLVQPWYNIDTPTKNWRSFSAWTLNNGGSTVRDFFSSHFGPSSAKTFTWTSGDQFDSAANGLSQGIGLRFTTTGALPTGLIAGQTYFAENVQTNSFKASTNSKGQVNVTPSAPGSGTQTVTPYPFLTQFGSLFTAGNSAKPDYIQGGGSVASDHTTRIAFNTTYWRSTKMVPPYLLGTVNPISQPSFTFWPMTYGPVTTYVGTTGERDDIGAEPSWFARHFFKQDASGTQTARTIGLVSGLFPANLRHKTNFTIPVVNNTSYTGMPSPNPNFYWRATGGTTSGFTAPADSSVLQAVFSAVTFDHMPELIYYPTLVFGDPQYNDMLVDWYNLAQSTHLGVISQSAIVNGTSNAIAGVTNNGPGNRDTTISGVHRYGLNLAIESGLRCQAWTGRTMGLAAAIGGGYEPAGAKTREYMLDTIKDTFAAYMAYIALLPSFAQNSGFWGEPDSGESAAAASWMISYDLSSVSYVAAVTEDANAIAFASHLSKYFKFVHDNFGTWSIPYYAGIMRINNINVPAGNAGANPYLTSTSQFAAGFGSFSASWSNGTEVFDLTAQPSNYVPTNNDTVIWVQPPVPSAFSTFTTYYMVSAGVGGATKFKLSASQGGAAITNSDTNSSTVMNIGLKHTIPTNNIANGGTGDGYMSNIAGSMNWAAAVGATVDPTTLSDINANLASISGYLSAWNAAPKYATGSNY